MGRRKREMDEEQIQRLYLEEGMSGSKIARLLNIPASTLYKRLREMGLSRKRGLGMAITMLGGRSR